MRRAPDHDKDCPGKPCKGECKDAVAIALGLMVGLPFVLILILAAIAAA